MNLTEEQRAALNKGIQEASAEYYKFLIEALCVLGHGKLNYVRTPIHMPGGRTYLLALLHVSGPVLDLRELTSEEASIESISGLEREEDEE